MKRRAATAIAFALAIASAAFPVRADWWNPVTSIVGEFLYQPIAGTVKVPWKDPCPSYAEWASRSEKEKVQRMAQYARYSYLENGMSIEGAYRISNSPDLGANGAGMESRTVSDYLGSSGSVNFEVTADGIIMLPGATGFQALLMRDQATGRLTLVFRGSEASISQLGDWGTDALQALGADTRQYEAAADLLKRILANTSEPIDVVGHSLGGGLTQYAMAMNDLQGRVSGYTYNSAGLSDDTIAKLSPSGIAAAGSALINVRVVGDPVSFAESHIGNIFDVENTDGRNAHSIETMIGSLGNVPDTNGPGLAYAPKAGGDGSTPLDAALNFLGEGLDAFLPSEISGPLKSLIDQYVRAELLKAAGMLDAKAQQKLAELKAKLDKMLPDDASRAAVNRMIGDAVSGNWEHLSESAKEAAFAITDHYILDGLDKAGLGKSEKEAILKTYHDAANAWLNDGNVGETITGNFEAYVYNKIKSEVGEKAANSWKDVWTDIKAGTDPWENFGKATLDTIEFVGMRELQQGLDKYFKGVAENNPRLAEFFRLCGIDTASVMDLAANIWGVLRGDGSVMDKLEGFCEAVAEKLYEWFGNLIYNGIGKAFDLLADIVEWVCSKAHELVEKADGWMEKQFDRGFDQDFSSLLDYVNAVAAMDAGSAIMVTDFAVDGGVQFEGGQDVQKQKTENVHDEAF